MLITCDQQARDQIYFLMIQLIIPRPIAWVLSDNGSGNYNLAPFSFFNAITSSPPVVMLAVGWKEETVRKDTWVNIEERNHFVVHIPSGEHVQAVSNTSTTFPHGVSEIDQFDLSLEKVEGWSLPRLKASKVALLCEKYAIHEIGNDPQAMILGKINAIWIDEDLISKEKNRITIDPAKFNPLARLGGSHYAVLGDILTIQRPDK